MHKSKLMAVAVAMAVLTATIIVWPSTADAQSDYEVPGRVLPFSQTSREADPACDIGGRLFFDVVRGRSGDWRWLELYLPPGAELTVDVVHHKGNRNSGNWGAEIRSGRRTAAGNFSTIRRSNSLSPFYWSQPGDVIQKDDWRIIRSNENRDGGNYYVGGKHIIDVSISASDLDASWRVEDLKIHFPDGTVVPVCGPEYVADGLDANGKELNALPVPTGTAGVDFSAPHFYDSRGLLNNSEFPFCAISTEFAEGPCFATDAARLTYLQEQVVADGCFGHVWIGGFDEPLVVQ